MGPNEVASKKGMCVYGLEHQKCDPKYCAALTEPVIHNGSQGRGKNGSEISDNGYQEEYPDEYHGQYKNNYPRDEQHGDQAMIIRFTGRNSVFSPSFLFSENQASLG